MRSFFVAILLASAGSGVVLAQPLTCPAVSTATGRPCEAFHYHVQMYRPDTRAFVEVYGVNQFASQTACDRARDAQFKRTMAVVEFYRARDNQQYQPDRVGPCHCDMTVERSSPNYLTDIQRLAQVRTAEEIRQRVRERLLDQDVPSDAEVVRGLVPPPAANPLASGPKLVPMPQRAAASEVTRSAADLKMTKAIDASTTATASLDLPLVDIPIAGAPPEPPSGAAGFSPPETNDGGLKPAAPQEPTPTPAPVQATEVVAPEEPPAEDAADAFVSYETQRIQNVLQASSAISDEAVKSKVLEACMQRIQLLSNLRSLIQGSGTRSRLATAARNAKDESERLALVAKLFGSDVPAHWAPKDAADVVLDTHEVDADPERVLQDSSGKFGEDQKRHALYALLARTQPTEEQQLWLTTVIDTFLQ
ncbi:MAG: hypothetical protein AABO58_17395 [Acidobacteriota bacterium]